MNCPNCQKMIPDDADFCKHCGAPAPFSSGINYHPETLFANETVSGSASSSASTEKAMSEMEERLNNKLFELSAKRNPKRALWHQIQAIASLLLVVGLIAGTIMFAKVTAKLEQINDKLDVAATADSGIKTSLDSLTSIQEVQDKIQADLNALISTEQADETTQADTVQSLAFQIIFEANYEGSETPEGIPPITMLPGEAVSLAAVVVVNREGYGLIGWNTKADGTGRQYALNESIGYFGYDVELFAQWKAADAVSVPTDNP